MANSDFKMYADYKYGPLTSIRRSQALKLRKELKESGEIQQGYIQYPAKLMVRYAGADGYKEHQDFSKMAVTLKKRSDQAQGT